MRSSASCCKAEPVEPAADAGRRAVSGDAEAFTELLGAARIGAQRLATVVLGNGSAAEDVVQDAALRAWRSIGRYDADRPFNPWFFRIVVNTARNTRRGAHRRGALELLDARRSPSSTLDPNADAAGATAEREALLVALNRMTPDDRLVLALRWFEQLSEREMADVLDCPPGTVKSRLARAMQRLRAELAKEDQP